MCFTESIIEVTDRAYVDFLIKGDMSSLSWIQMDKVKIPMTTEIEVFSAALNFRDVMLGSGRLSSTSIPGNIQLLFNSCLNS